MLVGVYLIQIYSFSFFLQVIDWLLTRLDLVQYGDLCVSALSGGTKRKLSTALALIGNPKVGGVLICKTWKKRVIYGQYFFNDLMHLLEILKNGTVYESPSCQ